MDTRVRTHLSVRTRVPLIIHRAGTPEVPVYLVTFNGMDGADDIALDFGRRRAHEPVWVRLHSACLTGDIFGSCRCDCGQQLDAAFRCLAQDGGVLLYLQQEGRGIGLRAKIDAYALQDSGVDTFEANRRLGFPDDSRRYVQAALMLQALDIRSVRLLGTNPDKVRQLEAAGIHVERTQPLPVQPSRHNAAYLDAKHRWFERLALSPLATTA